MAFHSAFAGGACTVTIRVDGAVTPTWTGSLALSQSASFNDPTYSGETYTAAVDAGGVFTLTSSREIGGTGGDWTIDIQPSAINNDVRVQDIRTDDGEAIFDVTMRSDGTNGDTLTPVEITTYIPDPYTYATAPTTSFGAYVYWGGT